MNPVAHKAVCCMMLMFSTGRLKSRMLEMDSDHFIKGAQQWMVNGPAMWVPATSERSFSKAHIGSLFLIMPCARLRNHLTHVEIRGLMISTSMVFVILLKVPVG